MTITKTNNKTPTQTMQKTPTLPTLYFSNDEPKSTPTPTVVEEESPSVLTLPPELLHTCLTKYADWGDLAKLACVQSKWKNIVEDAAEFGGRDAMWELSMCLLHGDDEHDGSDTETEENDDNGNESNKKNNRGLQKNEALAIKYLTRLSGVEIDETSLPSTESSSEGQESKSVLPTNWQSSQNDAHAADEAALLQLATCHLSGIGLPAPNPPLALHLLQSAYHLTNSVQSAHKLALLYEYPSQSNNLISIDVVAAFEWFKAAAENAHIPSMAELALCYELGCGVTQSDEEALDWYTKAANAGHSASHYSVGEHFEEARGVRMDHEEACLWYYRAAVLGEEDGMGGLRRLEDVARRVVPEADHEEYVVRRVVPDALEADVEEARRIVAEADVEGVLNA
mmetsp:Transcript_23984/g.42950  ORF Transcript_23984/g.42950 Transcript_23984/m.42950 type:complete len:397 (+) Transcript_23984:68-1258(+)|eukprot:CAMPEP_0201897630 /NCGR_PEP_ID=MMETSP0902-20130614/46942_1 /ASSEMBLY_ACC=CAM_ASM_000551 /TAXON_ID=420261 /ORGANISM="Thalassiosira antarctica, Strain CCMP982" /LENGTH=396 /DNA_ID=CAMNT_0048430549 /DNA_START=21 /DNA_END=1207 /DNA_ORIENTATION=-